MLATKQDRSGLAPRPDHLFSFFSRRQPVDVTAATPHTDCGRHGSHTCAAATSPLHEKCSLRAPDATRPLLLRAWLVQRVLPTLWRSIRSPVPVPTYPIAAKLQPTVCVRINVHQNFGAVITYEEVHLSVLRRIIRILPWLGTSLYW